MNDFASHYMNNIIKTKLDILVNNSSMIDAQAQTILIDLYNRINAGRIDSLSPTEVLWLSATMTDFNFIMLRRSICTVFN